MQLMRGASYDIQIDVYVTHKAGTRSKFIPQWRVYAKVGLVDGDNHIHLDSIDLPISDGIADPTPLIEYLQDNPLYKGGRALHGT